MTTSVYALTTTEIEQRIRFAMTIKEQMILNGKEPKLPKHLADEEARYRKELECRRKIIKL